MRLTERLLLEHVVVVDTDGDGMADGYALIEEVRDVQVDLEVGDTVRVAAGVLRFAAIHPACKEALLAHLLDLDDEQKTFVAGVLADAAEELRRAAQ